MRSTSICGRLRNPERTRILTDENVSPRVVVFLRTIGFDVADIKERRLFGLSDREILALAHAEQRLVITHDSDFGMLAINLGVPFTASIYIRLRKVAPDAVIEVFDRFLQTGFEVTNGMLIVIEEERVRVRTL
jgi:predicted nuclease of predicted toxin-antitoxin system